MYQQNNHELISEFRDLRVVTGKESKKTFNVKVKEYFPGMFRELRQQLNIQELEFIQSLSEVIQFEAKGGKSGMEFCITRDRHYIIKEISNIEFNYFMKFCPKYLEYVIKKARRGKPCMLCLIFAVFKVSGSKFIIMENITTIGTRNLRKYDLKGSRLKRLKLGIDPGSTLLDTNFLLERNADPLFINAPGGFDLYETFRRDLFLLFEQDVIDYSLFVVVDPERGQCYMKVIDFLRSYDIYKKVENKWKQMKQRCFLALATRWSPS